MNDHFNQLIEDRKKQGLLRILRPNQSRGGGRVVCNGRELIDFCSNDYLGLGDHPRLKQAIADGAFKYGSASGASRLMSGDLALHHELEQATAQFKGKEAALVFNSGFQANAGLLPALAGPGDCVFLDRLSHASLIDGIRLSGAAFHRFEHNSLDHLRRLLEQHRAGARTAWIVTETVFSMDGDRAPLEGLVELKERFDCLLLVDEAHATGVFGAHGAGCAEAAIVAPAVDLIMGTYSKALAGFGGYVACSSIMKDYLINTCRSFIYSTALPPCVIAGNLESLNLIHDEPFRRKQVLQSAETLRNGLAKAGFDVRGSSQIVPIILGQNEKALHFAQTLETRGYRCLAVRHPTVPANEARLRLSISYHHSAEEIEKLVRDITQVRDEYKN